MKLTDIRPDIRAYAKIATQPGNLIAGQVEVTSQCFQKCAMCESWRDDLSGVARGLWTLQQLQELCCELARKPFFEHLALTGGDPQKWPFLDPFLCWFGQMKALGRIRFDLQLNTALTQDQTEYQRELWRSTVRDVRISLDASTPRTYQLMRGDLRTPIEIVNRAVLLRHPRLVTFTCVSTKNIAECEDILALLEESFNGLAVPLRKAIFFAVLGDRDKGKNAEQDAFWHQYDLLRSLPKHYPGVPTSFAEDITEVRAYLKSPEAAGLKCYAGNSTFHVKCNGDWYPCCLTGGEALQTQTAFRMGNYFNDTMEKILAAHKPEAHYGCADKPCAAICQYKQLQLNLAAREADETVLSMP